MGREITGLMDGDGVVHLNGHNNGGMHVDDSPFYEAVNEGRDDLASIRVGAPQLSYRESLGFHPGIAALSDAREGYVAENDD